MTTKGVFRPWLTPSQTITPLPPNISKSVTLYDAVFSITRRNTRLCHPLCTKWILNIFLKRRKGNKLSHGGATAVTLGVYTVLTATRYKSCMVSAQTSKNSITADYVVVSYWYPHSRICCWQKTTTQVRKSNEPVLLTWRNWLLLQ